MSLTRTLASGLVAGAVVLGGMAQAEAADLTRSWQVFEAEKSVESKYGGGHGFWLPEMIGGGKFIFDSEATLNEYDDGTANFFGSIVAAKDTSKQWDFDIWFETSEEGTGGPKEELYDYAYTDNGGTIDTDTWSYYNFSQSKASQLTADTGTYAGQTLSLDDYTNGKFPMQIGYGASGKNLEMGFSTWFKYSGDQTSTRHADINVSLVGKAQPEPEQVPEPAMGLVSLGVIGLLKQGLKRRKDAG